jgi:hypothetical protein
MFRPIDGQRGFSGLPRSDEQDHRCIGPRILQFTVNMSSNLD